jgi:asparagine synthase (glutamine-hydrolysing)
VPEVPNEGMIVEVISHQWLSREETIWTGISRLAPSHSMTVSAAGVRRTCYWRPDVTKRLAYKRDEEYFHRYRAVLFDSVRRNARGCAPIACNASGALDSPTILSGAKHLKRDSRLPAPGLHGYIPAFYGDERVDEVRYARAVRAYLSLTVSEILPALRHLNGIWKTRAG